MPESDDDLVTYEAFCPSCEGEQRVMRTVPWQDDVCAACGTNVDGDERPE